MSKKLKSTYFCSECAGVSSKWSGQCYHCGEYNTLSLQEIPARSGGAGGYSGDQSELVTYDQIEGHQVERFSCSNSEVDRALGGGFVPGGVCVLTGDPGIGKSTLTLQMLHSLASSKQCLYISGEESLSQIKLRGTRLGIAKAGFYLAAQTEIEAILSSFKQIQPNFIVIDSIQTLYTQTVEAPVGSMQQIRQCAYLLTRYAKQHHATVVLIGHVTKDGGLAGPKVFEHMVDTVLYLEGDNQGRYRLLRTVKNRFGPVNELGILCMTKEGLKAVLHPSALFTNWQGSPTAGTTITSLWEGSRALLLEIQALVVDSHQMPAKRLVVGFDAARLTMLLAVFSRLKDWPGGRFDVFLNVVGGLKIQETAADCAILAAIYSSFKNLVIPREVLFFGEIGLSGELRPVQYAQERVQEAIKHGYKKIFLPKANSAGLTQHPSVVFLQNVEGLLNALENLSVNEFVEG